MHDAPANAFSAPRLESVFPPIILGYHSQSSTSKHHIYLRSHVRRNLSPQKKNYRGERKNYRGERKNYRRRK